MLDDEAQINAEYDCAVAGTAACLLRSGSIRTLPAALEDYYYNLSTAPWAASQYANFIGEVANELRSRAEELCDCDVHLIDQLCIESGCWYEPQPIKASFTEFFIFLKQMDHMLTLEATSDIVIATANDIWPDVHWTLDNLQDWPPSTTYFATATWVCESIFGKGANKVFWPQDDVDTFWRRHASPATMAAAVRLGYVSYALLPPLPAALQINSTPPRRHKKPPTI
jgi:hypothetical protein